MSVLLAVAGSSSVGLLLYSCCRHRGSLLHRCSSHLYRYKPILRLSKGQFSLEIFDRLRAACLGILASKSCGVFGIPVGAVRKPHADSIDRHRILTCGLFLALVLESNPDLIQTVRFDFLWNMSHNTSSC